MELDKSTNQIYFNDEEQRWGKLPRVVSAGIGVALADQRFQWASLWRQQAIAERLDGVDWSNTHFQSVEEAADYFDQRLVVPAANRCYVVGVKLMQLCVFED